MAFFGGKILYYPGCVTRLLIKDIAKNYEKLLRDCGIEFLRLDKEICCGIEALESGYRKTFYEMIDKNEIIFQKNNISKLISNCPKCVRAFNDFYGINAIHIVDLLLKNVLKLKQKEGDITYYDGSEMGRKLKVYEEPRTLLRAVGYNVLELEENRENTFCCGAGGGLKRNSPRVADKIAKMLLQKVTTQTIVTADPECYKILKENAENVKVMELSEVLV